MTAANRLELLSIHLPTSISWWNHCYNVSKKHGWHKIVSTLAQSCPFAVNPYLLYLVQSKLCIAAAQVWSGCFQLRHSKKKGESAFYKQIRLSYCFIWFRSVSRKSCRKVVVTRFFVVNDLFSTASLPPESRHLTSADLSLPVRHTHTRRKSAYPQTEYPSSVSAAGW